MNELAGGIRNGRLRFGSRGRIERKDGTTSWLPLKSLEMDNPLDVAKYAADNQIADEPAFDWWALEVLKRSKR